MLYVQKDIMITMNVCVSWLHVRSWLYVDGSCVWNSTLVHSVTTCSLLYSDLLIRTPDTFFIVVFTYLICVWIMGLLSENHATYKVDS